MAEARNLAATPHVARNDKGRSAIDGRTTRHAGYQISQQKRKLAWPTGRVVFLTHRFAESFFGYSFAEDVHLSARVALSHAICCSTRARLYRKDLGGKTHTDWVALGESMILNRHAIMADVLGRTRPTDYLRLFGYELVYCTAASLWNGGCGFSVAKTAMMLMGRLRGAAKILVGLSPHRPSVVQSNA